MKAIYWLSANHITAKSEIDQSIEHCFKKRGMFTNKPWFI